MKPEHVLTTALPYANGDLHLGHALEYVQADVYARARRMFGTRLIFLGAEDTHGTPIQLRAEKEGKTPQEIINFYAKRHKEDLDRLGISYDEYHTTHSEENTRLAQYIYTKAKENGYITLREIEHLYCEHDQRFLPDRYVKGTCPYCGAEDQYGDHCEVCGKTYKPEDLVNPRCAVCGNPPVKKKTTHAFFQLPKLKDWLAAYLDEHDFQDEVKNYVKQWLDDLKEWDITRDPPYFGIPMPDLKDKYFYVWLDAPIGYLATLWKYAKKHGLADDTPESLQALWNSLPVREHIIGKDIIYFHYLFWPALLHASGFKPPNKLYTHGHVTIQGGKMSKSRGTFILIRDYPWPADYLRYYYARHSSSKLSDIDYDEERLIQLINRELIDKIMNMHYRILTLATRKKLGGEARIPPAFLPQARNAYTEYEKSMEKHNLNSAIETLLSLVERVNKHVQEGKAWEHEAILREAYAMAITTLPLLQPIIPFATEQLKEQYALTDTLSTIRETILTQDSIVFPITPRDVRIIYTRIKKETNRQSTAAHPVEKLDLRCARITKVEEHPNADKLYILTLDLGNETRRIVSGIKHAYTPEELRGRTIILVANLKPAVIRGVESKGMLLAAEKQGRLSLLTADCQPGERVRAERAVHEPAGEVSIKTLEKAGLSVTEEGRITTPLGMLTTETGKPITAPGAAKDWTIR